jgi:hypothetical protein
MQGQVGQAFSFGGSGYVETPNSGLISSSWSFEAWVKPANAFSSQVWLLGQLYGRQLVLRPGASGPKVALAVSSSPYNWQVVEGADILVGVWSHVVGVCDSSAGTLNLYVNGNAGQPVPLGLVPWDSGASWTIGAVDGQGFSGGLDEVTVYSSALSSGQVQAIYAAGAAGKCRSVLTPPTIISGPMSQTVYSGDSVTFSVQASGSQPLNYQWRFTPPGGSPVNISGAAASSLTLNNVGDTVAGSYSVQVFNSVGSTVSSNAVLTSLDDFGYWPAVAVVGPRQDYTFKSGVSYYVGSAVELYGTTTLRGGSVIKFDCYYYTNASLVVKGALLCETQPYLPAILTSLEDNSQGERLWSPEGNPHPATNGVAYLNLDAACSSSIRNLRLCFAGIGVTTPVSSRELDVWDCQFYQCNIAIANQVSGFGARDILHNVLFANCGAAVGASANSAEIEAEQVTADVTNFWVAPSPPYKVALTNSIIQGAFGTSSIVITQNSAINPSGTVFQSASLGNYYLSANCPLHGAGTANVSPALLAEFSNKTTYAPVALPAYLQVSGDLTLCRQAPRYTTGAPDLGYWYDALDFTVAAFYLAGGTVQVLPGTAVAVRNDYAPQFDLFTTAGFWVGQGSSFISHGTPLKPNLFTSTRQVQETPATDFSRFQIYSGMAFGAISFVPDYEPNDEGSPAPTLDFRFSSFYLPPQDYHCWSGISEDGLSGTSPDSSVYLSLQDCAVRGGRINLGPPDWLDFGEDFVFTPGAVTWNSTLFDQVTVTLDPAYYWDIGVTNCDLAFQAYNNLFRGGLPFYLEPIPASAGNWVLKDNLFDKVEFCQDTVQPLDHANNGYWPLLASELRYSDTANRLLPNSLSDQVLGSPPPYQAGPFGTYYLPNSTPLFGAGSRIPADAGLFHYTTRVDQLKEGEETSGHMVNIGLHYVATASSGSLLPKDTDGDGIPDYVENWHGDGRYDLHTDTETAWTTAWTVAGIYDTTNTLYDAVDLSGSGLTGLAKKALGLNPLDPNNPLKLARIITGDEPITSTFEVPVSYDAVTAAGFFHLNRDGFEATGEQLARATNGHCLLVFNQYFDPPGQHVLSANFRMGDQAADGPILPFFSSNELQFEPAGAMFDDYGAFLDAKIFVDQADYVINLYDTSMTNETYILSITNTAYNGIIQEDWGVTNADGTPFTGTSVRAEFALASAPPAGGKRPSKPLQRAAGSLSEWGLNFDFAYMYTPTNNGLSTAFAKGGDVWNGMQGVVDYLIAPRYGWDHYNSDFNRFQPPTGGEYPGYLTSRADVANNLNPTLINAKQLYCYAHASGNALANFVEDTYIKAGEIAGLLHNSRSKDVLIANNPYRFVLLDGCSTGSTVDWQTAFGMADKTEATRNKTGPQAFVGWARDHTGWMNGSSGASTDLLVAKAYTKTLQFFYADWMTKVALAECIDHASLSLNDTAPFPVPQNKITRIHLSDGSTYENKNVETSRIYIVGHPGLKVDGVNRTVDARTDYKRQ